MIHDEELVLFHYREGLSDERRREIAAAIADDPALARRHAALRARLQGIAAGRAPAPASARGRWHAALDDAAGTTATLRPHRRPPWLRIAAAAGAMAAMLALGIAIGIFVQPDSHGPAVAHPDDESVAGRRPVGLARGLRMYVDDSARRLERLGDEGPAARARIVDGLIERNRLYRQAAERSGWSELARLLRAHEYTLDALRADPPSTHRLRRLHDRLAFELEFLQTRSERGSSKHSLST